MTDVVQIIAEIEAWLDKATPGEWRAGGGIFGKNVVLVAGGVDTCPGATVWGEMARVTLSFAQDADGRQWYVNGTDEANASYIAACSPDRIRALLDEVKRQRQENWEWKQAADVEARQRRHETDRATTAESRLREAVEVIRQLRIHVPHNSISAERARAFLATPETHHE